MTELFLLLKNEFLQHLELIKSLKYGNFTLASGKTSEYYLDLRIIPYHPQFFSQIMEKLLANLEKRAEFDVVCGIPLAGVPFATLLSHIATKPLIMLRKEPKKHGLGKLIEGGEVKGKTVLVVDDLISSGFSKELFIKHLREQGALVKNLAVIVDRRDKTNDEYKDWENEMKVEVISLFELSQDEILNYKKPGKN